MSFSKLITHAGQGKHDVGGGSSSVLVLMLQSLLVPRRWSEDGCTASADVQVLPIPGDGFSYQGQPASASCINIGLLKVFIDHFKSLDAYPSNYLMLGLFPALSSLEVILPTPDCQIFHLLLVPRLIIVEYQFNRRSVFHRFHNTPFSLTEQSFVYSMGTRPWRKTRYCWFLQTLCQKIQDPVREI